MSGHLPIFPVFCDFINLAELSFMCLCYIFSHLCDEKTLNNKLHKKINYVSKVYIQDQHNKEINFDEHHSIPFLLCFNFQMINTVAYRGI